jgi:glycosyltransferase involved in cell wall biosynthesis
MAKIILMVRVKDGIFYIKDWLKRYESLVDEIVAVDNGSTDGTYEVMSAHPKVISVLRTEGYNEGRDKRLLYEFARTRKPDWCMWLDVDEIFEPEFTRERLDKLMQNRYVDRWAFRRFHFIDRENFAGSRYWLNYSSGHDRIMWREKPTGYFPDWLIDSPLKGINGIKLYTSYRIKHLGYINNKLVDKKAAIYKTIIPEDEDRFKAMYIAHEKKIKWIDNRSNPKVVMLNFLLTCIQASHAFPKAKKLIVNFASSRLKLNNKSLEAINISTENKFSDEQLKRAKKHKAKSL